MVQPRPFFAWLLLGLVTCLLVLNLTVPHLLDGVLLPHKSVDLVPCKRIELPKSIAIKRVSPSTGNNYPVIACAYNDDSPDGRGADSRPYPKNEAAFLPAAGSSTPVVPQGQTEAQPTQTAQPPEMVRRLPTIVANIPTPIHAGPQAGAQPSAADFRPNPSQLQPPIRTSESDRERAERRADDSWREPDTLLESLTGLAAGGPAGPWATEVIRQIRALGPAVAGGSDESTSILERLADLNRQAPALADKIVDKALARKLLRTKFALGRRIDVWQEVVRLGVPQAIDTTTAAANPERLAVCLAKVDWLTRESAEGQAWREYLLVDALKDSSRRQPSAQDHTTQQLAQRVLERLTQTPLTPYQQKFVSSGPVAVLREELRRWAAEPVGATALLRDIETYERTGLPSDARRLALDFQHLAVSPIEGRRRLAERVDLHYRNASCRIAITEELLNKLIPTRDLEHAPVQDTVLGRQVTGESTMATELAVRMLPNPQRVRLALEVTGTISSLTTTEAGPARFHNDSQVYYVARKPLEIDMNGISTWPVEVDVQNQTQLRGVETPLDGVPLIGAVARGVAKSQLVQNSSAASQEVKQKVADKASQRIDAETRQSLTKVVQFMNERVFDPLNSLSLDPQLLEAETTPKRFTMRLRLAGEDQLGSHTPRPQAPEDSLASVQIHESVLNNSIQRLQLNGRTFTLPELSKHVAARLNRPAPWEISPDQADVKITFAEKDAVVVRCQDKRVSLTLSIAQLYKPSRKPWKNFQILAFYRPEVQGRSAELVRDGVLQLKPQRISLTTRMALDGIFSRALSSKNAWGLVPEQIVKEPKLDYTAITQFDIEDGWIGISLGRKSQAIQTAHRPRWGLW
jgi:hypothetical protein